MLYKTCTICKRQKPLDKFDKRTDSRSKGTPQGHRKSWCKDCAETKRQERIVNNPEAHERRKAVSRAYGKAHHKERAEYRRQYTQASVFGWLTGKFNQIRKSTKKRYGHTTKEVRIDRDYILRLWKRQKGLCALTGVQMTTKYNCPFSASPDRIDSAKGYIPGNVQLVSKSAQFAKGDLTMDEFKRWLEAVRIALI